MKNYRKRAAESFRSGIESPLEALGTRALREAQAELQSRDDRDPDALAMLDEALAHEPRDAHERRAAARAYLGVTKSLSRTKDDGRDDQLDDSDQGALEPLLQEVIGMAGSGVLAEVKDLAFDASIAFDAGDIKATNRALQDIADAIDGAEVDEWLQRAYEVVSATKKNTTQVDTKREAEGEACWVEIQFGDANGDFDPDVAYDDMNEMLGQFGGTAADEMGDNETFYADFDTQDDAEAFIAAAKSKYGRDIYVNAFDKATEESLGWKSAGDVETKASGRSVIDVIARISENEEVPEEAAALLDEAEDYARNQEWALAVDSLEGIFRLKDAGHLEEDVRKAQDMCQELYDELLAAESDADNSASAGAVDTKAGDVQSQIARLQDVLDALAGDDLDTDFAEMVSDAIDALESGDWDAVVGSLNNAIASILTPGTRTQDALETALAFAETMAETT